MNCAECENFKPKVKPGLPEPILKKQFDYGCENGEDSQEWTLDIPPGFKMVKTICTWLEGDVRTGVRFKVVRAITKEGGDD